MSIEIGHIRVALTLIGTGNGDFSIGTTCTDRDYFMDSLTGNYEMIISLILKMESHKVLCIEVDCSLVLL